MVILIDTNVALDFLAVRQPYYDDAREVIRICADEQVQGYIAFHSLPNIFYVLRKSYSEADRRRMLKKLCFVLQVTVRVMKRFVMRLGTGNLLILKTVYSMSAQRKFRRIILLQEM